jgi:cytochrome c oxidase subunit IV
MAGDLSTKTPTTRMYIRVALLLGLLTAIEVALFYIVELGPMSQGMANPLLISLAIAKFLIVVGYFMHLKYEIPLLSRTFAIGAILALGLYAIVIVETLFRTAG